MNVPTITVGGNAPAGDELEKLKAENRELQAKCAELEKQLNAARSMNELIYMRGRCDGLEFSIRCNGVSGQEVVKT